MSLRKVEASGTKGVGWGIGVREVEARAWRLRRHGVDEDFRRRDWRIDDSRGDGKLLTIMIARQE